MYPTTMRSFFEYPNIHLTKLFINIQIMNRILFTLFFFFSVSPVLSAQQTKIIPQVICFSTYEDYCEGNGYNMFNMSMTYYACSNSKWWELNEYRFYVPAEEEIESITFKTFAVQVDSILYVNMRPYKGYGRIYKRVKVMPDGSLMFVNNPKNKRIKRNSYANALILTGGTFGGAIGGAIAGAIASRIDNTESSTLEDQYCYVLDPLSKKVKLVNEEVLKSILADKTDVFDSNKTILRNHKYNAKIVMQVLNEVGIISEEDISSAVSAK